MEALFEFVQQMPSWQKLVWIVVCMSFGAVLEALTPRATREGSWWQHARVNFVFLATTIPINSGVGAATLGLFDWVEASELGLLNQWEGPVWLELLVALGTSAAWA